MFRPNAIQLPLGLISASLEQVVFLSPQLRATLLSYGVDLVKKAFPEFVPADTLKITSEGWIVKSLDLSRVFTLRLPAGADRKEIINALVRFPDVIYAEPNANATLRVIPNDQHFNLQWNMHNSGQFGGTSDADIDAAEAWDVYQGSSSVLIAIVDGGVSTNNTDLSVRVSGNTGSSDHATHVAGIAAAKGNNSFGVAGVDWNCSINSQIIGDIPQQAQAVKNAVNAGARILNNSWGQGTNNYSVTLADAFAYAYKNNAVSCNAMPEEGSPEDYPNAYGQGIINVGATTNIDQKTWYSFARDYIDVAAPGGNADGIQQHDIYSTFPNNGFGYMAGTSMSAPHVTGIASLLKGYSSSALGKTLYNDDLEQIIKISADDINDPNDPTTGPGWDQGTGTGRVNTKKALDLIRSPNVVRQWKASGGSSVGNTDYYTMVFYSTPGLATGVYIVKRYEVRKTVNFGQVFQSTPHVWGRGVGTNGYSAANPNFGMGWCDVVSHNNSSVTLKTYVYKVWTIDGTYVGWIPTSPSNVTWNYTVLGIPAPLSVNITGPTYLSWGETGTFTANPSGGSGTYINYQWWLRNDEGGIEQFANNGVTPLAPPYGEWIYQPQWEGYQTITIGPHYDFSLKCKITDSDGNTATDIHSVIVGGIAKGVTQHTPVAAIEAIPEQLILIGNYPNPFNPTTSIKFGLPDAMPVEISIYSITGKKVRTLINQDLSAGYYQVNWDGTDKSGNKVASGIYIYTLKAGSKRLTSKMLFAK